MSELSELFGLVEAAVAAVSALVGFIIGKIKSKKK